MESINSILAIFASLVVRLGIPVVGTVILIAILRKLDARWQAEAEESPTHQPIARPANTRCWEARGCSKEKKSKCPAYSHQETPCWQLFRSKEGILRQGCIDCQVFHTAPVPVTGGD